METIGYYEDANLDSPQGKIKTAYNLIIKEGLEALAEKMKQSVKAFPAEILAGVGTPSGSGPEADASFALTLGFELGLATAALAVAGGALGGKNGR